MPDQKLGQFTLEEVLGVAQGNVNSLSFVTIVFLKEHNLSPTDLWHFIGEHFAQAWPLGIDAIEMAKGAALNWVSVGGKLVEISGDQTRSTVVLSAWPPVKVLEAYGIQPEDADNMLEIMRPIAGRLGFDYEWKRENDRVIQAYTKVRQ